MSTTTMQPGVGVDQIATSDAPAPAVEASDITRRYGAVQSGVQALAGVSMNVPVGQFTAVMGPSGSGKSTLMHILAGLDAPDSGTVRIGGTEITGLDDKRLTLMRRREIGFVFQAFNLLPMLSAEENIVLPFQLAGRKPDRHWVETVLATVGLTERRGHRPAELSGGQQQRVAVARALITEPTVLFADEPTGNLDSRSGQEILGLLRQASSNHEQTTVMVTHDPRAAATADRVVFLSDGRIVSDLARPDEAAVIAVMAEVTR
jgi:ABC-type lipoprotein export system ATPase subunit